VSSDAESDSRRDRVLDLRVGGATAKTALAVPLEGEGDAALGALAIYNKRAGRPFNEEDRELLVLVAANASTAVRLQLSREAREHEERLTTIGRLLSSVIHDLKTPLTVMSGYVQLMQAANDPAQRERYAELILKQFDHIGAMQREVLEFARGEKSVLVRKVYLQKFFDDVREQLEGELARRGVGIEHRLFQSFVTSGKAGGTGLGLAIVKKIAEEHGGAVTVQSSSRGATFKLRIPQPRA
jgi:signal transduction histidine kinase